MSTLGSHEQLRRLMVQIIQDAPVNGRRVISEIAHNGKCLSTHAIDDPLTAAAIFGEVPTQESNDAAVGKESPYSASSAGPSTTSFSIPIKGRPVHDTPPSAKGQPVKPRLQSSSWKTGHRVHKVVAAADAQPTTHAPTQNPLQDAVIGTVRGLVAGFLDPSGLDTCQNTRLTSPRRPTRISRRFWIVYHSQTYGPSSITQTSFIILIIPTKSFPQINPRKSAPLNHPHQLWFRTEYTRRYVSVTKDRTDDTKIRRSARRNKPKNVGIIVLRNNMSHGWCQLQKLC